MGAGLNTAEQIGYRMLQFFPIELNPTDTVPVIWDWSEWVSPDYDPALLGDVLESATVTALPGTITIGTPAVIGNTVRVFVGNASLGQYVLSCTVHTVAGLTATSERNLSIVPDAR